MEKDFEFVLEVMDGFVKQRHIQKRLNIIKEQGITGWEIWFQIEFASYIDTHKEVAEWHREKQYHMDKRKSKDKFKMAVDFLLRQKRTSKGLYIALELKQHFRTETCIKNMLNDVLKVNCARQSHTGFRSFWCIGIHPREESKVTIKNKIEKKLIQKDMYMHDLVEIRYIPNTNYAYTIF